MTILYYWGMREIYQTCISTNGITGDYFVNKTKGFPFNRELLVRVLVPLKGDWKEIVQWILKSNSIVIPRRTSRPFKADYIHSATDLNKCEIFDGFIDSRWGTSINPPTSYTGSDKEYEQYKDDYEPTFVVPDIQDTMDVNCKLLNQQPDYDKILQLEFFIILERRQKLVE